MHYPLQIGQWRVAQHVVERPFLALEEQGIVRATQPHGGQIASVQECGEGNDGADGVLIIGAQQKAAILTADCMPLVVMSDKAALALHVSRRSLARGLLDRVADWLPFGAIRSVYLGPHICPECFTFEWMGEDLRYFQMLFPRAISWEAPFALSLREALQSYLDHWGIDTDKLIIDDRCTMKAAGQLPSYKRALEQQEDPNARRLATVVWKEEA